MIRETLQSLTPALVGEAVAVVLIVAAIIVWAAIFGAQAGDFQ
jgi:uncharacterized membrane protein YqiK